MKPIFIFCLLLFSTSCDKKEKFSFQIQEGDGFLNVVSVPYGLADIDFKEFVLYNEGKQVAYQIDSVAKKMWFVHLQGNSPAYTIESTEGIKKSTTGLWSIEKKGNLQLSFESQPVLQYRYEMTYPPKGVDSIFKKSGYIHPIITPKGDTLTRIQPPDHYHHYGLWGPWTHTRIDTTRVDFWNLGEGMGTVLFKEFKTTSSGSVFSSFTATQEHWDFKTESAPQVALNEDLHVRLWNLGQADRYMFDYTTTFHTPLEDGILFEAYRYGGGIGLRFNERWKSDNCSVLTSEGKNRLEADGTNARWCIVTGESSDGQGTNGILFMSHPENRMHPEPMRIWPIDANGGRGDMFFEFCPIRHKEWKIEPNKDYQLNYRMVVFEGELTPEEAEAYWQSFASPLEIKVIE